jgi:hypothetical protein
MLNDDNNLTARFDWIVHIAQLLGMVGFVGGIALMLLNLRAVWSGQRRWPARAWSIVLVLSSLTVLWVAVAFNLIGFGVSY